MQREMLRTTYQGTGKDALYLCDPRHEFVEHPMDDVERIEKGTFTLRGKAVTIDEWITKVKRE